MTKRPSHDPHVIVLDLYSMLDNLIKYAERARDDSKQWPNSYGHGYNVGRLEALQHIRNEFLK